MTATAGSAQPSEALFETLVEPERAVRRIALELPEATFVHAAWSLASSSGPGRSVGFLLLMEEEMIELSGFLAAAADVQSADLRKAATAHSAMSTELILALFGADFDDEFVAKFDEEFEHSLQNSLPSLVAAGVEVIGRGLDIIETGCRFELNRISRSYLDEDDADPRYDMVEDALGYVLSRYRLLSDLGTIAQTDAPGDHFIILNSWFELDRWFG